MLKKLKNSCVQIKKFVFELTYLRVLYSKIELLNKSYKTYFLALVIMLQLIKTVMSFIFIDISDRAEVNVNVIRALSIAQ